VAVIAAPAAGAIARHAKAAVKIAANPLRENISWFS
jgi:hypothetical protein